MTKRERELAKRHLAEVTDLRDAAWLAVQHAGSVTPALNRYEALKFAVELIEATLVVPEAVAETEAA